jgi:hypothetical protein
LGESWVYNKYLMIDQQKKKKKKEGKEGKKRRRELNFPYYIIMNSLP